MFLYMDLYEPINYTIKLGGKKTRSLLVKYAQSLLNNHNNPVTKLIIDDINKCHNASLIIDDIQDEAEKRRGEPCAYKIFGTANTINSGYLQVFTTLNEVKNKYPKEISSDVLDYCVTALKDIHYGQGYDIYWSKNHIIPSINEFLTMIDKKTGVFFKLIANLCLLSDKKNHDENYKKSILLLFQLMGRFFQIRDDYINLTDPNYWRSREFCEDFDEKKVSYMFVKLSDVTKNTDIYRELINKDKLTKNDKLYFYKKLLDNNILYNVYLELENYKNKIIQLEKKLTNSELVSEFLKMYFKKLYYNPPSPYEKVKLFINIL